MLETAIFLILLSKTVSYYNANAGLRKKSFTYCEFNQTGS